LRHRRIGITSGKTAARRRLVFDDDEVRKPKGHEVGMPIDAMSVDELEMRIAMLRGEIGRLEQAIAARRNTRAAADSLFKR
jgi:uncharacterized small protein (DUF1192 family)